MSTITPTVMRGLEYAKYLYKKAGEESNLSGFSSKFSVLTFHDAIEIFLYMACIHNQKRKEKRYFTEFWNLFPECKHKAEIDGLTTIRNKLKHNALEPTKKQVKDAREYTNKFLIDNIEPLFGVKFIDISMTRLITYIELRRVMQESELAKNNKNYEESVYKSAEVFYRISRYINTVLHRKQLQKKASKGYDISKRYLEEDNEYEESFINSLNIDLMRYYQYKEIIPRTWHTESNGDVKFNSKLKREPITEEEAQLCFDFVIDVILSIQEYE